LNLNTSNAAVVTLTQTAGTLSGTGHTVLNGPSSLSGGFFSMLTDQQVENHGTATITNGNSIDFRGNAVEVDSCVGPGLCRQHIARTLQMNRPAWRRHRAKRKDVIGRGSGQHELFSRLRRPRLHD
jgi:hypothetical protein